MGTTNHERVDELRAKAQAGTISEDEYVELLRADDGEEEAMARHMYRTSYAAQHAEADDQGRTTLI
ncbi:hypothetical protein LJ737_19840 [Hymenobacter sp. 15J16-1T3B]|uniref:hypothetical protein n=1 Tax=Hymenobacter sp. 15J16-1T3B TaxID=2886941 RepID=UPI001D12D6CC|nr:hypothetical protein [Hymenobacter sp. 15J16-1T3B]MCC3159504.1 hypothetical protein [Hymenobacter sp. 15J16-1T3B]